jgi:microcystin-dependent protein
MDAVIGIVTCFAGTFIPRDWASCDGQALLIHQHPSLFKILGTLYGGDGVNTFQLPDLRGRTAVSSGRLMNRDYNMGDKTGSAYVTLQPLHVPAHSHTGNISLSLGANRQSGTEPEVNNNYPSRFLNGYATSRDAKDTSTMGAPEYSDITIGNAGSNTPVPLDTRTPFLVITYIICLRGIFPSKQ